ncbi:MAG TPA: response regulator [Blastocatellia bacterium]|nr:response regulator [Blastocatellia bacterium]
MLNQKRILIADDDKFIREMLRLVLSRAGYDLQFVEDGQCAVDTARTDRPDLVLTDGLLPKLHGFEACKLIKAMENPPKVVVLTGVYTKPTYKWQIMTEFGADAVLNKPFQTADLLGCIEDLLAERYDCQSGDGACDSTGLMSQAGGDAELPREAVA